MDATLCRLDRVDFDRLVVRRNPATYRQMSRQAALQFVKRTSRPGLASDAPLLTSISLKLQAMTSPKRLLAVGVNQTGVGGVTNGGVRGVTNGGMGGATGGGRGESGGGGTGNWLEGGRGYWREGGRGY